MNEALAVKYRPQTFEEVVGQNVTVKILKRQLDTNQHKNCYLFTGGSGCGKTSIARIFARELNHGVGTPIEIDAASNNGVDYIRSIVEDADKRALDAEYKVYIIDECVSGDTEVLTENGWKRFDTLNKTEKIAQYTDSGKIEFVVPIEFIEKDYMGKMYKVNIGNKAEFIMSPNHVQPLYYKKSGKVKESYIKDITFAQSNYFIRSGNGAGTYDSLSSLDRLAIALQADGCLQHKSKEHNYWTIQLTKQRKVERLIKLLKDSSLEYLEIKCTRSGARRFRINTPINITKNLTTHFNLEQMSANYAHEFIEELMLWDGYKRGKYYYYSSVDKVNVDFCQCVGILGGFKSRIGNQTDNRKDTYRTMYRLYLEDSKIGTPNKNVTKESFDFNGKIYCVKVPSHKIIIRRNGFELITGNCHVLSNAAWQAFLKCIEEPPKYTIFIFCTTNPEKIPVTIQNRVQKFTFTKIPTDVIKSRLMYVCEQEHYTNYEEACQYIANISNGGMRTALAHLDKCQSYSTDLSINNVLKVLGDFSYKMFFDLTNAILDMNSGKVINIVEDCYNSGNDLKLFINQYLDFVIDVTKFCLFKDIALTNIPNNMLNDLLVLTDIEHTDSSPFFQSLANAILNIKNAINGDTTIKLTILVMLTNLCRGN